MSTTLHTTQRRGAWAECPRLNIHAANVTRLRILSPLVDEITSCRVFEVPTF